MEIKDIFDVNGLNIGTGGIILLLLLAVWEMTWKGFGLWKAARNNQTGWFVAILIFNTIGILPILYIYFFSPKNTDQN